MEGAEDEHEVYGVLSEMSKSGEISGRSTRGDAIKSQK